MNDNDECEWSGAWTYDPATGLWADATPSGDGTEGGSEGLDSTMLIAAGGLLLLIIVGTLMFMRRGGEKEDAFGDMGGAFGTDALDPTEQYVQQLIAQGYPEETARAFAAQYVGGDAAGAAAQPAAQAAVAQPAVSTTGRWWVRPGDLRTVLPAVCRPRLRCRDSGCLCSAIRSPVRSITAVIRISR